MCLSCFGPPALTISAWRGAHFTLERACKVCPIGKVIRADADMVCDLFTRQWARILQMNECHGPAHQGLRGLSQSLILGQCCLNVFQSLFRAEKPLPQNGRHTAVAAFEVRIRED